MAFLRILSERGAAGAFLVVTSSMLLAMLGFPPVPAMAQSAPGAGRAGRDTSLPRLATKVAFPSLRFDRPVALAYPADGSNLLFVAEQHAARVWSFPNQPQTTDKQLFLELPDPINRGNEEGLLGLAFHPRYKENGKFFVSYSAADRGGRRSVVSRFRAAKDNPRRAEPASEER